MKVEVLERTEKNIVKIDVRVNVPNWCNCEYSVTNGEQWIDAAEEENDELETQIKSIFHDMIEEGYWHFVIDADSGKIANWPKDVCIKTCFKIVDDGRYQLIDDNGKTVWDSDDVDSYVPDFLALEDSGYGDYLIINVNGDGQIEHWDEAKSSIKYMLEEDEDD